MYTHPGCRVDQRGPDNKHGVPSWIVDGLGRRSDFVRLCGARPDLTKLGAGESVIAPGAVYRLIDIKETTP